MLSVQEEILDTHDRLMVIDAEVLLPRIGGYNSRPYSVTLQRLEPPRSSELKAIWRWWMRVALSTIYGGSRKYNEVEKLVSELLGSTDKQSYFTVILESTEKEYERTHDKINLIEQLLDPNEGIIINIAKKIYEEASKIGLTAETKLSPPIIIKFKARKKGEQEFGHKLKELYSQLDISIKPTGRRQARVIIKSSKDLKRLTKRLGLIVSQDLLRIYDTIVNVSEIPRVKLILQPHKQSYKEVREDDIFKSEASEDNKRYLQRVMEDLVPFIDALERLPVKATILLNRKIDETRLRLGISVFFLALTLGGLGSITRRGFGSIIIKSLKVTTRITKYFNILNEETRLFEGVLDASGCKDLKENIIVMINHVIGLAKSMTVASNVKSVLIPEIPILMYPSYFKFNVFECQNEMDIYSLLKIIGKSTLKITWKNICGLEYRMPGGKFHTWILGLPRKAKYGSLDTGYFREKNEEVRRISAINYKIFENRAGKRFIIVYGFLSKDWPLEELIHKGKKYPKGKNVNKLGIMDLSYNKCASIDTKNMSNIEFLKAVFNSALKFVITYLKRELGEDVECER